MEKIRVLFVASEFAPGMIPFSVTIINTLASDCRFEVHCLCVCSGRYTYKGLISKDVHSIFIEYPTSKVLKAFYKFWPISIVRNIILMKKTIQPDIIHFLSGDFTLANYILLENSPIFCYTVHDMHPHEVILSSFFDRIMFRLITSGYKRIRNRVNNLTTSSYAQLEELKYIYPYKYIEYTPFPTLVTSEIINGYIEVNELIGVEKYILFFGSVQEYKGIRLLIEAFDSLNLDITVKLVIAGKGLQYNGNNKNIIRINRFINDNEIRSLFDKAIFVVYPYLSATMSGVLSIAYYFHKHVLLSDISFFRDSETNLCTFFKKGDVEDLKSKMIFMLDNIDSVEYSINNDCSYERMYSTKVMSDAYYKFYKTILA